MRACVCVRACTDSAVRVQDSPNLCRAVSAINSVEQLFLLLKSEKFEFNFDDGCRRKVHLCTRVPNHSFGFSGQNNRF